MQSQYNMCYDKHVLVKGDILISTVGQSLDVGTTAFTAESIEQCKACCADFFREATYAEECLSGCGVLAHKVW
jgi:hypothetical protein